MGLRHIRAFGGDLDITVSRVGDILRVYITNSGKTIVDKMVKEGEAITVDLKAGK